MKKQLVRMMGIVGMAIALAGILTQETNAAGCGSGGSIRIGGGGCRGSATTPIPAVPTLVGSLSEEKHTLTTVRGTTKDDYTFDNFTRIYVDGKPGKISDVSQGMKITVVANGSRKCSRIDVTSPTAAK